MHPKLFENGMGGRLLGDEGELVIDSIHAGLEGCVNYIINEDGNRCF
jgi:hypothetical protein